MSLVDLLPIDLQDRAAFAERLQATYGEPCAWQVVQYAAHTNTRATYWINPLRVPGAVNTLRPEDCALDGLADVWVCDDRQALTHSEAAERGEVYVQNPSSILATRVLAPVPGDEVLDLAAAPGGKTIAVAAAMGNQGRVAAVEPVPGRFHRLRANVERCGCEIVEFYQRDGRGVGKAVGERFDRVLLDAPCSSESRMRWDNPRSYRHWQLRKVKETQRKQRSLLRSAYASVKPGGVLVYCTCSFSVEENERVVNHLLKRTDAEVLPFNVDLLHTMPGLTEYRGKSLQPSLAETLRILPEGMWDGFYIAKLKKPG